MDEKKKKPSSELRIGRNVVWCWFGSFCFGGFQEVGLLFGADLRVLALGDSNF